MPLSVSADWACGHALRVPARPVHSRAAKLGGLFQCATIITGLPGSQSCPYEPSSVRSPPAVRDHQRPALGPTFTRSARARNALMTERSMAGRTRIIMQLALTDSRYGGLPTRTDR